MPPQSDDRAEELNIIRRLRSEEVDIRSSAQKQFCERYRDRLFDVVSGRIHDNPVLADDVVQMVLMDAMRWFSQRDFEDRGVPIMGVLWKFAVRQIMRESDDSERHTELDDEGSALKGKTNSDISKGILDELYNAQRYAELHREISTLKPAQRFLLHAYYWDGKSMATIADEIGSTEGAVKTKIWNIRKKLKGKLTPPTT